MQTKRKCVHCNTLNDPGRIYCIQCGKYLKARTVSSAKPVTVWGFGNTDPWSPPADNPQKSASADSSYYAVCPQCSEKCTAAGGHLPVMCPQCGYFFQAGIDQVVSEGDLQKQAEPVKTAPVEPQPVSAPQPMKKSGPMPSSSYDTSKCRLIAFSAADLMPEMMKESGNIIGSGGTVFRKLKTDQRLFIWHSATGWYLRAEKGHIYLNGSELNLGVERKLADGNSLIIGNVEFRAEIL